VIESNPWVERVKRIGRSTLVGLVATVLDMVVFELCTRVARLDSRFAAALAVAVGTTTQFIGSRYFAFRAQKGRVARQMKWFLLAEFVGYWLTVGTFTLLRAGLPAMVPNEVPKLLSGSLVYFGFSYPIWRKVFRVLPHEEQGLPAPAPATASAASPAAAAGGDGNFEHAA
jgi:putative flippase GtrA